MPTFARIVFALLSLSARRAWIENHTGRPAFLHQKVALRKESVDRKMRLPKSIAIELVALRKESVDRKSITLTAICLRFVSLSARRAWIENL